MPSCSGRGAYTIRYGGKVEDCECTDYQVHRGEVACKHLTAVALLFAARRRRPCGCRGSPGVHYIGHMVEDPETGAEQKVVEAVRCRRCQCS